MPHSKIKTFSLTQYKSTGWFLVSDWIYAPTGPGKIAQGNALGHMPFSFFRRPEGAREGAGTTPSIPYILFVIHHAMFLQKMPEFFLKRHFLVMLFL